MGEILPSHSPSRVSIAERVPMGVVGAITPWNFPLILGMRVVAPALALGNTVVLKPSPETPLTGGLIIAELLAEAGLPAGVLNVVTGDQEIGERLVAHPDTAMIHFTGSSAVGSRIAEVAGKQLKRVSLELGGNNALVILEDADLEQAAMIGAWSAWHYQGQTCITAGRHIVARPLFDAYVEALAAKAAAIAVGDPARDEVGLGPMINERQRDRGHKFLTDSVAQGATIVEGGTYDGLFYRPTVVTDITYRHATVDERDLRPDHAGAGGRLRGRGDRARQRHAVRARERGAHRRHGPRHADRVEAALRHGACQRLDVPRRGARPVRRPRRLRARRPGRRRVQPRGVHRAPLGVPAARPLGVPVLMDTEVLIVGAGPSGAVAALRLAQEGFQVTVLEQGDWPDYGKANTASPEFAVTADRDWGWDPNARAAPGDYPIDESESDITALMWNGVGGGTIVYAAQWQRNMPSDFRVRSLDGVADDWPFTYEDLEPYYVRVEQDFGISGLAGDTAFPPGAGPPLPPVPLGAMGRKVAKAHNDLGWHWWPAPLAIATRQYGALNPCVQRATCLNACADGAKASVDRTHWPKAIAFGVNLITRARVRTLTTRRDGLVGGAIYLDDEGNEHEVKAEATIVCANGIGTPRLLLLSAEGGLANSSGLVGKRLMMHPFGTVVGLFEDDLGSTQGPWGQHLHCLEFYETDDSRGFVRGAKWGLQPTGGPTKMTTAYPWGAENSIWGPGFHENVHKRLGHSAMWGIIAEDLPEEHNRVCSTRSTRTARACRRRRSSTG